MKPHGREAIAKEDVKVLADVLDVMDFQLGKISLHCDDVAGDIESLIQGCNRGKESINEMRLELAEIRSMARYED